VHNLFQLSIGKRSLRIAIERRNAHQNSVLKTNRIKASAPFKNSISKF